jgi:hypothetical protein
MFGLKDVNLFIARDKNDKLPLGKGAELTVCIVLYQLSTEYFLGNSQPPYSNSNKHASTYVLQDFESDVSINR